MIYDCRYLEWFRMDGKWEKMEYSYIFDLNAPGQLEKFLDVTTEILNNPVIVLLKLEEVK